MAQYSIGSFGERTKVAQKRAIIKTSLLVTKTDKDPTEYSSDVDHYLEDFVFNLTFPRKLTFISWFDDYSLMLY